MFASTEEAIGVLRDTRRADRVREDAVYYLAQHPSAESTAALVAALRDDFCGVRWACGSALALAGEAAIPALLRDLVAHAEDVRLRDAARHILRYNASARVRRESHDLVAALKGSQAALAGVEEAHRLLVRLESDPDPD